MEKMFFNCSSITSINLSSCSSLTSIVLSSFDTSNVESMSNIFSGCSSLINLELSNFITSKVKNMEFMFFGCSSLSSLDLSNFNTSKVTNMKNMFYGCKSLNSINLSNFNTKNVTTMTGMFYDCINLTSIDISSFNTESIVILNYMFYNCSSLISLNLANFKTPKLVLMDYMFESCNSLISLDISNLITSEVTNMSYVFSNCKSLVSLSLSNFITSKVTNMVGMFYNCFSLNSLDLSNFVTSQVTNFKEMFFNCSSLNSLKLSNFNTGSAINMEKMFSYCESLTSLNLNTFITSQTENMNSMFYECKKLEQLALTTFVFTSVTDIGNMFYGCKNLEYINLINYNELRTLILDDILYFIPDNVVICLNQYNKIDQLKEKIKEKSCYTFYCGEDWKSHQKKLVTENNTCVDDCSNFKYENGNKCYETCPEGVDFCQVETQKIDPTQLSENDDSTNVELSQNSFELESDSSKTDLPIDNLSDSYELENELTDGLNLSIEQQNEIIYQEIINSNLYNFVNSKEGQKLKEGKGGFYFYISNLENNFDFLDEKENTTIRFSKVKLGAECESELRKYYTYINNASLITLVYEKLSNSSSERNIQYEVYESINMTKLDLSVCKDLSIDIYVPLTLSQELQNLYEELKELGYDLFDINDKFYQDICSPYKSSNGTDVLLADRIYYYYNNEETKCQSNCKFSDYLIEPQYLKCECDISNSEIHTENSDKFNPKIIYKSFYDVLKFSNYKTLKCYKLVFIIDSLTNNIGSIIVIVFACIYIIFIILYFIKGNDAIKENLKAIKKNTDNNKPKEFKDDIKIEENNIKHKLSSIKQKNTKKKNSKKKYYNNPHGKNEPPRKKKLKSNTLIKIPIKSKNDIKIYNDKLEEGKRESINSKSKYKKIKGRYSSTKNINIYNDMFKEKLDNYELNNLEYEEALKLDKRKLIDIYWSLLNREHLILFTFCNRNDYNIIYIKFARLIFLICTDMVLNVFFFADETMHKMFLDYGIYNIIQQIPQAIYSTVVSQVIQLFLCFLCMTDKYFYQIKNMNTIHENQEKQIIKCIKLKLSFFVSFTFIMFAFYWYAISCFCAVYKNTQIAFIKDSAISFGLGLLYPFILYLFPSLLRIISLKVHAKNLSCIYKISDIIPFF